jgi:hypothetical protein
LLGIVTAWPPLYIVLFIVFVAIAFAAAPSESGGDDTAFRALFLVHLLTMLWIFALIAFYIVNVFRNPRVAENQRTLWARSLSWKCVRDAHLLVPLHLADTAPLGTDLNG